MIRKWLLLFAIIGVMAIQPAQADDTVMLLYKHYKTLGSMLICLEQKDVIAATVVASREGPQLAEVYAEQNGCWLLPRASFTALRVIESGLPIKNTAKYHFTVIELKLDGISNHVYSVTVLPVGDGSI